MMGIPSTRTDEEIQQVSDWISGGGRMARKQALAIFQDLAAELQLLRSESREWVCLACAATVFCGSEPKICPSCNGELQPVSWCLSKIYERNIEDRDARIRNLNISLEELLDLDLNSIPSPTDKEL